MNYSYGYSLLFVGDANVGKTSLIVKICDNIFHEKYVATKEYSDRSKDFNFGISKTPEIRFKFWDSPGNSELKNSKYIEKSEIDAIIFVFDLTSKSSFKKITSLIEEEKKREISGYSSKFKIVLANKADLENKRKITADELKNLCHKYRIIILETSAKTHLRLDEFLCDLFQNLFKLKEPRIISSNDEETMFSNNSNSTYQIPNEITQKNSLNILDKQENQKHQIYEITLFYGPSQKATKKISGDLKIGSLIEPAKTIFGIPNNVKVDFTDLSGGTINLLLPLSSLGIKHTLFLRVWNTNQKVLNIIQLNKFNLPLAVETNIKIIELKKTLSFNLKIPFESIILFSEGIELRDEQTVSEIPSNNINLTCNNNLKSNKNNSMDEIRTKEKLYPSLTFNEGKVSVLIDEHFSHPTVNKNIQMTENLNSEKGKINYNIQPVMQNNLMPPIFYDLSNNSNSSVPSSSQNIPMGNANINISKSSRFVIQNLIQEKEKRLEENYNCPICHLTLSNPVNLEDGYTYDKECLDTWFKKSDKSPMTGQQIQNKNPPPNIFAKATIKERIEEIQALKNTVKQYK